jgi:hypothetical protein
MLQQFLHALSKIRKKISCTCFQAIEWLAFTRQTWLRTPFVTWTCGIPSLQSLKRFSAPGVHRII